MFVGNAASRRVAEGCGYRHEGTMRKAAMLHGEWRDVDLFSLMREECPSLNKALEAGGA
jgi:RimJ/RimL family protein N-acetyltransferase